MTEPYRMHSLKVVFISKLRPNLQQTVCNLQQSLPYVTFPEETEKFLYAYPKRLQRRAWRVTYLKSPFKYKQAIKNYVFHDWRYQFTFRNLTTEGQTAQEVVSACLGSMDENVNCIAEVNWTNADGTADTLELAKEEINDLNKIDRLRSHAWYKQTSQWNNIVGQ